MMQSNNFNTPYKIVITGSVGTGKSTASKIIMDLGYNVFDCDKAVHIGYKKGENIYYEIVSFFGKTILNDVGDIDRKKLGEIVFKNIEKLKKLNEIVHKYIINSMNEFAKNSQDKIVFFDIPLMFEEKENLIKNGLQYNEIWLVYVPLDIQKKRLIIRAEKENKNIDSVLNIIRNQILIDEKVNMSDKVIYNDGTLEELKSQIIKILSEDRFK